MKHFCGGLVMYRQEECVWVCQRCGEAFDSVESLHTSNLVAEHSDEELEVIK